MSNYRLGRWDRIQELLDNAPEDLKGDRVIPPGDFITRHFAEAFAEETDRAILRQPDETTAADQWDTESLSIDSLLKTIAALKAKAPPAIKMILPSSRVPAADNEGQDAAWGVVYQGDNYLLINDRLWEKFDRQMSQWYGGEKQAQNTTWIRLFGVPVVRDEELVGRIVLDAMTRAIGGRYDNL